MKKERKITGVYYWYMPDKKMEIQIVYNEKYGEVFSGDMKKLKEIEEQSGIKAKKV